jgi:carbon monoxide dehydrogenase subunit G
MRRVAFVLALTVCSSLALRADFSYEQTSKITGGILSGAMKVVGVFSKQAVQPVKTSVLVKGNRMAHVSADNVQVIDLDRETITDINLKNRTYSVITFAQMMEAMERAAQKISGQTKGDVNASFKASVKDTGEQKQIAGLEARRVILTLVMEAKDKDSGATGALNTRADMWLARDVPGYSEVQNFYQRMSQKIAWTPGAAALAQGRSDMAKAMADLARESSKLEGVPVLQIVSMGGDVQNLPEQPSSQPQAQPQPKQESERPSIGGALGRLGGLGGLGRRRQEQPKQEPPPQPAQQSSSAAGVLMEITTETTGFSTAPVDPSRFEIPAGFRQVESELVKSLR